MCQNHMYLCYLSFEKNSTTQHLQSFWKKSNYFLNPIDTTIYIIKYF